MPSLRHDVLARGMPRLRKSSELDSEERERARIERWHADLDAQGRLLPTNAVVRFRQRYEVQQFEAEGPVPFAVHRLRARGTRPRRRVLYLHGGGFVAPLDPFHVRYAARLASALDAEVLLPDYPLAPAHTWADSHGALVDLAARLAGEWPTVLAGDSAGGGVALAVAQSLRDRGGPTATHLLLHSPWVDLTTSTPATTWFAKRDPWLRITKLEAYARWWAGSTDDLGRHEVSPALADLSGLPRALMFCGTRDLLVPGCRLLARRAEEAGWDLTYVEEPGLIHVYPLISVVPEAKRAWHTTVEFLGRS